MAAQILVLFDSILISKYLLILLFLINCFHLNLALNASQDITEIVFIISLEFQIYQTFQIKNLTCFGIRLFEENIVCKTVKALSDSLMASKNLGLSGK